MTKTGKALVLALAGASLLTVQSRGVVASSDSHATNAPGNPFQGIIDRNVFGLKPPPSPADPEANKPPPPKITPTGIITFGSKRALFKVQMPAKPPKPAAEEAFMLGEGEREGEIEVLAIDEKAGSIKFNNYGTIVTLTLEKDGAKLPNTPPPAIPTPGAPAPAGFGGYTPPAAASPYTPPGGAAVTTIGGGLKSIPTRTLRLPAGAAGINPGIVPGTAIQPIPNAPAVQPQTAAQPQLTPEEQMIIIEAQRERAKSSGDAVSKIFPPTPLSAPGQNAQKGPPLPQ